MKRTVVVIMTAVALVAGLFWLYRGHKNAQQDELATLLQKPLLYDLASAAYSIEPYQGPTSALWLDRSYGTTETVDELHGLMFIRVARNSTSQLLLESSSPTTIYTLGNSNVPNNYVGWEKTDIAVSVLDSFEPRAMNAVYKRTVEPGRFILNFWEVNPAAPVFFDAETVRVVQ